MKKFIDSVIKNDVVTVKILLEKGVDPNLKIDNAGLTPLHFAAQNNSAEVAALLLAAGANPASATDEGETPIDIAMQHKSKEVMRLLILYHPQKGKGSN